MNEYLRKISADLLFSSWVDDEERAVVEKGWKQFREFFGRAKGQALRDRRAGSYKLYRLLTDTNDLLKYVGDPRYLTRLTGLKELWGQLGRDQVADAFQVRIDEAKYDEPISEEEPPEGVFWQIKEEPGFEESDEAPPTLRSLVARTLYYAGFFAKEARG
jgi:hypothetical protein